MNPSNRLELHNVSKVYQKGNSFFHAVHQVSLQIQPHEVMGLMGESGSGKSTLAKMILMLEKPSQGTILFNNQNIWTLNKKKKFELRRQIQIVFQNPFNALNPRMTLEQILNEPLDIHNLCVGQQRKQRIEDLLHMVGLEKNQLSRYPHQFSGGQLQRICIARALAVEPSLLLCDEPLSALDLSISAQIINLLRELQKKLGLAMLFISHDLAAIDMVADRVAVMNKGEIVEVGSSREIFHSPKHPYTQNLVHIVSGFEC